MNPTLDTPFFAPWRSRLAATRRTLPRTDVGRPILHQLETLFGSLLPRPQLQPSQAGPGSRQRHWPRHLTFWTFLAQVLSPGSSCRAAVRQAQAHARLEQRPVPADDTSAYCQARRGWPVEQLHRFLDQVARTLQAQAPRGTRWCGREVKIIDATTFTAQDTPANQRAFPQPPTQKPGTGFPMIRLVALFSLATGALLGFSPGTYGQSELSLATPLWALLQAGDILLGDRLFGCYRVLALVCAAQADVVCRLHASRKADLRYGRRAGPWDRQVVWSRPPQVPPGLSLRQWRSLPATLTVRLVRFRVAQKGFRTRQVTLVTTLRDAQTYPPAALAALYCQRWQIELSFRQIKTALAMDHLAVRSPQMIARSLAMHLLAYQLIRGLMQEAALTAHLPLAQISFQGSVDAARHFGEALLRASSQTKRLALLTELRRILAADALPYRPGRVEPRALKRRAKPFPNLNCPRRQFREIPHRHAVLAARAKARRNSTLI